jgi:TonB family protein
VQSTRHDAHLAALHSTALQGHVLDVIVLTSDGGLLATLRDASGPEHAIWHAPTADAAVDLLIGGRCGILIADLGTLRGEAAALLARLHVQFPELVLMATGRRDEEASVASLVSDGRIYRFLHKPISPARGSLFLSAASRRYFELRNAQPPMMSTVRTMARRPPPGRLVLVAGAVVLALGAGVTWIALRDDVSGESEQLALNDAAKGQEIANLLGAAKIAELSGRTTEPRGNNAIEYYQGVLKLDAGNAEANAGLERLTLTLEEQFSAAIEARDAAQGAAALGALRKANPGHHKIADLQAELIALSRSIHSSAPVRPARPSVANRTVPATDTTTLAVPSEQPEATLADASSDADQQGTLEDAMSEPGSADAAAPQTDALPNNDDALEQLELAIRLRERNMLLAPPGNNAFEYLQSLASQNPSLDGLQTEQQRLAFTLLDNTRTALLGKHTEDAARFLNAAEQLMPGMAAAQQLREQLQSAQEEQAFWQSIAEAGSLKALRPLQAEYPREARLRGTEGWVDVEFTILPNGTTEHLIVRDAAPKEMFDASALQAVKRARFEPFSKNGQPIKQRALLRVKYELE